MSGEGPDTVGAGVGATAPVTVTDGPAMTAALPRWLVELKAGVHVPAGSNVRTDQVPSVAVPPTRAIGSSSAPTETLTVLAGNFPS
jgi:hypothetical protein